MFSCATLSRTTPIIGSPVINTSTNAILLILIVHRRTRRTSGKQTQAYTPPSWPRLAVDVRSLCFSDQLSSSSRSALATKYANRTFQYCERNSANGSAKRSSAARRTWSMVLPCWQRKVCPSTSASTMYPMTLSEPPRRRTAVARFDTGASADAAPIPELPPRPSKACCHGQF